MCMEAQIQSQFDGIYEQEYLLDDLIEEGEALKNALTDILQKVSNDYPELLIKYGNLVEKQNGK